MKILLSVKALEKLQDYIVETLIDTGDICENRMEAREYIDRLVNTKTITELQYDQLIDKIVDYSDELLNNLQ